MMKRRPNALARLASMVEVVTGIKMTSAGVVTSQGAEDDGDHELDSEAAWHFGFYSRPLDGARGVVLKADGQGNTSFLIGYRDTQYELTLEKGEVGIKNAFDAEILLDENGQVIVNQGTKKVARVDDTLTRSTALATWAAAVDVALTALQGAAGAVVPVITAPTTFASAAGTAGGLGDIHSGADDFLA
jgi:phage gp45-like